MIEIKNRYTGEVIVSGASIKEALDEADLRGADLCRANFREADLREADLRETDLCEANLCGYMLIKGSKHDLQYYNNYIRIGCYSKTIDKWLRDYQEIGIENNYTEKQIKEYKKYIDICREVANGDNG